MIRSNCEDMIRVVSDVLASNPHDDIEINSPHEYLDKTLQVVFKKKNESWTQLTKSPDAQIKSTASSILFRQVGNKMYKKRDWRSAFSYYNTSIRHAESGSLELAFGYANRSALLFERKFYKECLEDISRALSYDYPEDKKHKLLNRKKVAEECLPSQEPKRFHGETPTILNKHPNIQAAADCITINHNDYYGRFIEATRDINAGEIIAVEKPYATGIFSENKDYFCDQCAEFCLNMIPCSQCSAKLFCSETCLDKAFKDYHRYECILCRYYSHYLMGATSERVYFRSTLKGLKTYKRTEEEPTKIYQSGRYNELKGLVSHIEKFPKNFIIESSCDLARLFFILRRDTDILTRYEISENDLKYLILRDKFISLVNNIPIVMSMPSKSRGNDTLQYGAGLYTFCSLFNHSCVENVTLSSYGSTVVFRAKRKIMKGEQCFSNYGLTYLTHNKETRQKVLQMRHLFTCECEACKDDWPMYSSECVTQGIMQLRKRATRQELVELSKQLIDDEGRKIPLTEDEHQRLLKTYFNIAETINCKEPNYNLILLNVIFEQLQNGNTDVDL